MTTQPLDASGLARRKAQWRLGGGRRPARFHETVYLLVNALLTGRLLLRPSSMLRLAWRNESRFRLMAGTLLLFVVAGVDAAASLGLGWLFLRCYPEVTPWLNDVSDLQWPARTWGAMLGVAIFLVAGLLRLHQATPLHRSTLYWAAAVAGPRILISLGSRLLPGDDLSNAGMMDEASLLAFGALCALVGFSPQILAMVYGLIVCASAAVLFWSLGPFRSWWRYARSLTSWNNVPALQQIVLDSSLKNVKQNDFNNEVARSGCGEVKRDFKIDDILDGFLLAR